MLENGLTVDANAIVQDSEVCEAGKELPCTPAVKLKLSLLYTLKNSAVRQETTARYVSDQYSESENRKDQRIDAYATVDLKAVKPFKIKAWPPNGSSTSRTFSMPTSRCTTAIPTMESGLSRV